MRYTKEKAIKIVTQCAKTYKNELINRDLLFLCEDKQKNINFIECSFDASNFLHLTGLKITTNKNDNHHKPSAKQFFDKCINSKLKLNEFEFSPDGTTDLKLDILPVVMNKYLSANMIGDYNSTNPFLYTEKLIGNVKACVGFISVSNNNRYIPNTVLKLDIRDCSINTARVIAVFRKYKNETTYSEITYIGKNINLEEINLPDNVNLKR